MIEVRRLVKDYGPLRALDGISFSVGAGEVAGFLGPNGAGKTTCMKIVTGFISATSGSVAVNGLDTVDQGVEARRLMGYLPENAPVYGEMTVGEYLTFIARVRMIPKRSIARRVMEVAETTGVQHRLNQETGTLSRGFRQRTGLAAALIHNPQILILDEPTSGLDPNQIVEIRSLIRDIGRDRTVILSTHNLAEVTAVCNRIIIVHLGRIVADGTCDAISRDHGHADSCLVSFSTDGLPDHGEVAADLGRLEGCMDVTPVRDGVRQQLTFRLRAESGRDLRPAIFSLAAARNWGLVELRSERLDLETIFSRLTRQATWAGDRWEE